MIYNKILPICGLTDLIDCYFFLKTESEETISDYFFPNGKPAIVFHFENPFEYSFDDEKWQQLSDINLIECTKNAVNLRYTGLIDTLSVVFKPHAISKILKFDYYKIDSPINLQNFAINNLYILLKHVKTLNDRIFILNSYFSEKFKLYKPENDKFKQICDYIIDKLGVVCYADLSQIFNISERYIYKIFMNRLGVSFKVFCRIIRVSKIIEEIYINKNNDWFELLLKYNYVDQAHFINDFKKITGLTPNKYFKYDKNLSAIFSTLA